VRSALFKHLKTGAGKVFFALPALYEMLKSAVPIQIRMPANHSP
jgi:hypothetical protein